jgi:hypothetical protein
MKTNLIRRIAAALLFCGCFSGNAQTLINIDFGAGSISQKSGFAATGQSTNDFWNRYRHYEPRYMPDMAMVAAGRLEELKYSDGAPSKTSLAVSNAPGVWGNATGDSMHDSYIFAPNGSNIMVRIAGLEAGRYHFYLYGHAAADVSAEQNTIFSVKSGTNRFGPMGATGVAGWQAGQSWRERGNYVVFRNVEVAADGVVLIEAAPGQGGIAVVNGLQILSRGTAPPRLVVAPQTTSEPAITNLLFREIHYEGKVSASGARFEVKIEVESRSTNEIAGILFEGNVALLSPKLPEGWRIVNEGKRFTLHAAAPGNYLLEMQLAAKSERVEPWNQISFAGPPAAIGTVSVESSAADSEVQLQSGTTLPDPANKTAVRGVLGSERQVAIRWQSKTAEVLREAVLVVNSDITARVTPAIARYVSRFTYEILQARVSELKFTIPPGQTLTKLEGEQVRDWQVKSENGREVLTVEFIRPIENAAMLTLMTEQPLSGLPAILELVPPGPLGVQRENGAFRVRTEDVTARLDSITGLRQVSAAEQEALAFRFSGRPAAARARIARVTPELSVASRVRALLEENRMLVRHELDLRVTKAGIYQIELTTPEEFTVTEVSGEGIDDWKATTGNLQVTFRQRILGDRTLEVVLERGLTNTPPSIAVVPLRVAGAARETAWVGAGSSLGIQLKTATLAGIREISINALPNRRDELLAYRAEQPDWLVTLSAERLSARLVAEVFNLLTIGDGIVGGSATVRFGIVNQGVQQFRMRLPAHWRNVEFTGLNLRRKDRQGDVWTISLQDKAWNGYTLVITYDYAFDPKKAALDAAGAHPLDVERESGTIAITTATGLMVEPATITDPLRRIDPTELAETDRALITRPVLLACRYDATSFALTLNVTRHNEVPVLDAVADRAQLTSVVTSAGEMLTQASFMVKNNERQFQRFQLPARSTLWGVTVNGQPVKADRDGDWLLVSLPRAEDRDQAFAVDIQYAQQLGALGRWFPRKAEFIAPKTDIPGTYAQWELYVPADRQARGFGGNMTVARGTSYGFRDAWDEFARVYRGVWHDHGAMLIMGGGFVLFLVALVFLGRRHGMRGIAGVLAIFCVLGILAGMLLPALSKAKSKAQRIKSVNNLKNIGLAARIFSTENDDKFPSSFDEMMSELATDEILHDPETGERYTWVGAGKDESNPNAILAFSSPKAGRREVLMADGSVQQVTEGRFNDLLAKEAASQAPPVETATVGEQRGEPLAFYRRNPELMKRYFPQVPSHAAAPALAGAGGGGAAGAGVTVTTPGAPVATGIKSLKIELPRSGRAYHFTRALNLGGEPPRIQVSFISTKALLALQMVFQLSAFVIGLAMAWFQWRRARPKAFWLAIGVGLALVGTAHLFIAWRALHLVLIVPIPAVLLLLVAWIVWRIFRRRTAEESGLGSSVNPATASVLAALLSANVFAADPAPKPPVSIVSAVFEGETHERVARLKATLRFDSTATNATVMLFGKEAAVREFKALSGEIRLWRDGERIGVLLPERGSASAEIVLLVKLAEESGRRRLQFGLPPALASTFSLLLDEPDAAIDFPTAIAFERTAVETGTRVEAVLGATDRVELSWTPKLKRAGEITTTAFARQSSLIHFASGAVSIQSILDYQISQGELRQLRVAIPEGQRVLRAWGEMVRSWNLANEGRNELVVELLKGASAETRLSIESEMGLDELPATISPLLPKPLDVNRVTGVLAIRGSEELGLTVERADGLERIENSEFVRLFETEQPGLVSAWRFLRPDFDLSVRVEMLQPRVEAVARHSFTVGEEQVAISSHFQYTITRAGLFSLAVLLPDGARIDAVNCEAMKSWNEKGEGGERQLEISLKERTLGAVPLELVLIRAGTNLPPILELNAPHPLGVEKLNGFIAVSAEPGIGIKTGVMSALTEIPAASLPVPPPNTSGLLAFKFIASEIQPTATWSLGVTTELLESWVRAEIVSFITVSETLLSGRTLVRHDIQNAPRKDFVLKIPSTFRNVEILGAGIRRRDQTNDQWRIELQNKVRGEYQLTVLWEQPRAAGASANPLSLAGVEAPGVERETGAVSFHARAPLQLTPRATTGDLLRVDARELPAWAPEPSGMGSAVLVYRYLRPGWRIDLSVARFNEAAVLQALVDRAFFRTVVADDGQLMTQMELTVRNNGRQHLEITLPPNAKVWSAFVNGQPVRPAREGNSLLLPLEAAADTAVPVELTYVNTAKFPRARGKVELVSPRLDVPLKEARWELFLPPDYEYEDFRGTMNYEQADAVPMAREFTLAEYARQEIAKKETVQEQEVDALRQAKSEFENRNYPRIGNKLSLLRDRSLRSKDASVELKKLEDDLNRARSSNLIQAQQALSLENAARFGTRQLEGVASQPARADAYDTEVAEKQVAQLQKAQQVAVARVTPLRVNLPTRGLRHSFAQVLQTEVNKPLTIIFSASNDREIGWFKKTLLWSGGFVALWIVAGLALLFRAQPAGQP